PLTPLLGLLMLFGSCTIEKTPDVKVEEGYVLGSTYQIRYQAIKDSLLIKQEIQQVLEKINSSLSTYLPTSDLSAINSGDSSRVISSHVKEVYSTAEEESGQTAGYFDASIGGLIDAWGFGAAPSLRGMGNTEVDSLMAYIGFGSVYLSHDNRIIREKLN